MEINQEFMEMLLAHKHLIYKVCLMYADSKEDINDIYQETVFNLYKSFPNFQHRCDISTWIYRIALNTCITDIRKREKHRHVSLELCSNLMEDCEHDEMLREMYSLIKRLSRVERMFIMLWLDGKTYDEMAEITGVCRNNVASRLHRIKNKLKQMSNL